MKHLWLALVFAVGVFVCGGACRAGDVSVGVFAHDRPLYGERLHEGGEEVVAAYGTNGVKALSLIGTPSIYVTGGMNLQGKTNFVGAGLRWKVDLSKRLYLRVGAGMAVNDAPHHPVPGRIWSTSSLTFEPEGSLGWKLTKHVAIEASYIHMSNGWIFSKENPGLNEIGVRAIVRFDAGSLAQRLRRAL